MVSHAYGCVFFFFKQKTAYEMRISDWSSDVCSSDLRGFRRVFPDLGTPIDRVQIARTLDRPWLEVRCRHGQLQAGAAAARSADIHLAAARRHAVRVVIPAIAATTARGPPELLRGQRRLRRSEWRRGRRGGEEG